MLAQSASIIAGAGEPLATGGLSHIVFAGSVPDQSRIAYRRSPSTLLSRRTTAPLRPFDPHAAAFLHEVCTASGVNPDSYRDSIFHRRSSACLRAAQAQTPQIAAHKVQHDPQSRDAAFSALMIGVTAFFRDPHVFEALAPLLRSLASPGRGLSVLSVGCSDGSELYSVAMLLAEADLLDDARLEGIDCRAQAITTAKRGTYNTAAVAQLGDARIARHFGPRGNAYQIDAALRDKCAWRTADAMSVLSPPSSFDLIFCRNLAIYLTPQASKQLWSNLASLLRPGGLLVVGKAERPGVPGLVTAAPCIYRKSELRP